MSFKETVRPDLSSTMSSTVYCDRYSDGALQFDLQPVATATLAKPKTRKSFAVTSFRDRGYHSKVEVIKEEEKKGDRESDSRSVGQKDTCDDCCCCRTFYSERFRQFSEDTTLHGLRYAVGPHVGTSRRIFWTLLMIGMIVSSCIYLYLCWVKFLAFPVKTVVSMNYKTEISFPAITICNYNHYRKSYVNGTRFEDWVRQRYPTFNFSDDEPPVELDEDFLRINRTWFEISAAHDKWNMIYQCTFGRSKIPCDASNFTLTLTDFGVCYTFNGGKESEDNVLHISNGGSEHGLRLRLFVEQFEYTYSENSAAGFKILAHRQNDVPMIRNFGFAIPPGTESLIGLKMIQEHNLPAPYVTRCSNEKLEYFEVYTHSNCVRELNTNAVVENCGCREPYMPGSARVCNYNESVKCAVPVIETLHTDKDCPVACSNIGYETRVSYASFPGRHIVKDLEDRLNLTQYDIRENIADLKIYFEEISYEEIRQEKGYAFPDLIGDSGGELGLCLGASLLTMCEIVEFFLMWIWRKMTRFQRGVGPNLKR
ncbi:acid-sensing ion channel 1C-like [Ptychodera flava]|uniref:acid-sensing ion channel 1C-like n=1 Tax=Ptychodera flava TaxID=63121 RepID=UPI00396A17D1